MEHIRQFQLYRVIVPIMAIIGIVSGKLFAQTPVVGVPCYVNGSPTNGSNANKDAFVGVY